jgi:uncharacterized lipoprotein YddW (UPF0748 family)
MSLMASLRFLIAFFTAGCFLWSCSGTHQAVETSKPEQECDAAVEADIDGGIEDGGELEQGDLADAREEESVTVREARGVWVARWDFKTAADVKKIIATAQAAGFNQVYFQVRGVADAYYKSSVEPWAAALTGKLGKDPGWDPLQVAIDEARQRGLELHAWMNISTAWRGKAPPGRSKPKHILKTNPDWRVVYRDGRPMPYSDGYVFVNPINPEVHKHLQKVVAELASFYSLDGIHFDYARFPAKNTSYDRVSKRLFRKAKKKEPNLKRVDWQRRELAKVVASLSQKAKEVRPQLEISAAVTGIYKDRWGWRGVTQGLVDFHQDSHLWAELQAVDTLIPMIYWPPTNPAGKRCDFFTLAEDFKVLGDKVKLLAGLSLENSGLAALKQEIEIARQHGYQGFVVFSYGLLAKHSYFDDLEDQVFASRSSY